MKTRRVKVGKSIQGHGSWWKRLLVDVSGLHDHVTWLIFFPVLFSDKFSLLLLFCITAHIIYHQQG